MGAGDSSEDLSSLEETITRSFTLELNQYRQLQEKNDAAREEERVKKHDRQQKLLEDMLNNAVTAEEKAEKRRVFVKRWVLGPGGVVSLVGAIVLAYVKMNGAPVTQPEDVKEAVTKEATELGVQIHDVETRLDRNDRIHERMVGIQLDQQVQFIDGHDQLVELVLAPTAAARKKVRERQSVTDGRTKAKAIKNARDGKEQYDPADPLADLRDPKK